MSSDAPHLRRGPRLVAAVAASLALGLAAGAQAGSLSCSASVAAEATLRAEGKAERVSDLLLTCTGGTPTPDGAPVPRANVTVFLNTGPASRVYVPVWGEPLLLVDDPAPGVQRACDTGDGVCNPLGTGTGIGTYDGSAGRPNVFQGQQSGNAISWPNVPIDPPGEGTRLIRLTNIRVDASKLAPSTPLSALVTASGDISLPITNPNLTLGTVVPSLTVSVRNALSTAPLTSVIPLQQCLGASMLRIATVRFTEKFAGAWRKRAVVSSFAAPSAVDTQNTPGAVTNTESGFVNASLVGHPARGPIQWAGIADFGTRLKAVFGDVPPGVKLYVDTTGASVGGAADNTARMTQGEWQGFLPATEAPGIPGTAPITLTDGLGKAVWEITDSSPGATNSIEFGVYVTFSGDPLESPPVGTATIGGTLAPSVADADIVGAIPRFVETTAPVNLFSITACGGEPSLIAAVLPGSRSVKVGASATVFATVINAGTDTAIGCRITQVNTMPATLTVRTTDASNQVVGSPPVDIPIGTAQTFLLGIKPTSAVAPVDVQFRFDCDNSDPAPTVSGVNTLWFSAVSTLGPDVVALAATPSRDGIVGIPGPTGSGAFSVATVNVGAAGPITVSADTGTTTLAAKAYVCQTDPATGLCFAPPAVSVTATMPANSTATFGVFVAGSGTVPFAPATNRVFVRFKDGAGVTRGATSVAVRTE